MSAREESPTANIPGGCVLLARKMLDSDLMSQSPLVVKLWVWLLLKANWKDRDQLARGQLVTTIQEMREAMSHYSGWRKETPSPDEIRSAYGALRKTARVTVTRTVRGVVITILNYGVYQDLESYASHTGDRKGNAMGPAAVPHDTEISKEKKKEYKTLPPEALRLSERLADLVLKNNAGNTELIASKRQATVARWGADIERIHRLDGQPWEHIEAVIDWSQADSFWAPNILSGTKLRKQFNQLFAKMAAKPVSGSGKQQGSYVDPTRGAI
jgi:hypothetical protein